MHKAAMLCLFALALTEISAGYWLLLIFLLPATAFPSLSPLLYPVLTLYLGLLATLKTIYQFPLVREDNFNLTRHGNQSTVDSCYDKGVSVKIN